MSRTKPKECRLNGVQDSDCYWSLPCSKCKYHKPDGCPSCQELKDQVSYLKEQFDRANKLHAKYWALSTEQDKEIQELKKQQDNDWFADLMECKEELDKLREENKRCEKILLDAQNEIMNCQRVIKRHRELMALVRKCAFVYAICRIVPARHRAKIISFLTKTSVVDWHDIMVCAL